MQAESVSQATKGSMAMCVTRTTVTRPHWPRGPQEELHSKAAPDEGPLSVLPQIWATGTLLSPPSKPSTVFI